MANGTMKEDEVQRADCIALQWCTYADCLHTIRAQRTPRMAGAVAGRGGARRETRTANR